MRTLDMASVARVVVMIIVGGIGAAAGFTHTHGWAEANGQHGWLAWADAVVIECPAVVAGFEMRRDHLAHRHGMAAFLPRLVLVVAFLIQMTAQVAQAPRTPAGWLLAAMPALAFLTVVKLALRHVPATGPDRPPVPAQATRQPLPDTDTTTPSPAPQPASGPPAPPAPALPSAPATLTRIPARVRSLVADAAAQAYAQGRPVTAADITTVISLPDSMLTPLVNELNATVDNHPGT